MNRSCLATLCVIGLAFFSGCGSDPDPNANQMIDVTPANAKNIIDQTEAKLDTAMEQNTKALDAAIEAQTTPSTQ
jgi:ABC-type uncharacterized transport system auxiliary subunit